MALGHLAKVGQFTLKIDCSVSTLYGWGQGKEIDADLWPSLTTDEHERLNQL